jgi:hypothetical protein
VKNEEINCPSSVKAKTVVNDATFFIAVRFRYALEMNAHCRA